MDQRLDRILIEVLTNPEDIPQLHIGSLTNPGDMFIKLQVLIQNMPKLTTLRVGVTSLPPTHVNINPRRIKNPWKMGSGEYHHFSFSRVQFQKSTVHPVLYTIQASFQAFFFISATEIGDFSLNIIQLVSVCVRMMVHPTRCIEIFESGGI